MFFEENPVVGQYHLSRLDIPLIALLHGQLIIGCRYLSGSSDAHLPIRVLRYFLLRGSKTRPDIAGENLTSPGRHIGILDFDDRNLALGRIDSRRNFDFKEEVVLLVLMVEDATRLPRFRAGAPWSEIMKSIQIIKDVSNKSTLIGVQFTERVQTSKWGWTQKLLRYFVDTLANTHNGYIERDCFMARAKTKDGSITMMPSSTYKLSSLGKLLHEKWKRGGEPISIPMTVPLFLLGLHRAVAPHLAPATPPQARRLI